MPKPTTNILLPLGTLYAHKVPHYCIEGDGSATGSVGLGLLLAERNNVLINISFFLSMSVVFGDGFGGQIVQETVQVVQDSAVALLCDVPDANPPPEIVWFNSAGEMIKFVENEIVLEDDGRYLFLATLTAERLQDMYCCQVMNVNLTETITSSTQYSLSDDLPAGELLVYKGIGDLVGRSGDTLEFRYVVGYRPTVPSTVGQIIICTLGEGSEALSNAGIRVTVPVPEPVGSKNRLAINCIVATSDGFIELDGGSLTIVGK